MGSIEANSITLFSHFTNTQARECKETNKQQGKGM